MKRLRFIPVGVTLLLVVSCSIGKGVFKKSSLKSPSSEDKAVIAEGSDLDAYLLAGIEKLRSRENESASLDFKKALILEPGNVDAYYYLALSQQRTGQLDDAVESYQAAIKNDPAFYEAIFNLATVYGLQKKFDLALTTFNRALGLRPNDGELHYNLALCFDQRGRRDEAIVEYQKAVQFEPKILDAYMQMAEIYEQQGKVAEAMTEYKNVLRLEPGSEIAHQRLTKLSSLPAASSSPSSSPLSPSSSSVSEKGKEKGGLKKWLKIPKISLSKIISAPGKLFKSGKKAEPKTVNPAESSPVEKKQGRLIEKFSLGLNNKLVTGKDVSFNQGDEDNTITSKRAIAQIGYSPDLLNVLNFKDTKVYVNLGSVSLDFDKSLAMSTQSVEFKKAVSFAYGLGISSAAYELPAYHLGFKLNLDFVHYAPEIEADDAVTTYTASADVSEYQLAADTVYKGFSKFAPYLGLLYNKTSGSFELSGQGGSDLDFNEKNQIGCRLGTAYQWQKNISFAGEYRLLDENALSLLIHYVF